MKKIISSKEFIGCTLNIIIILLPFIMVGFIMLLNGYGINYSMLLPAWNDEVGWWTQVNTLLDYGKALGYNGYNGTHAIIGTSGPWGPFPLFPYVLFGKIYGWKLYSMALANMTFLSLALLIYLCLTKPDNKQKMYLIITYCLMAITVGYSMTSMSEGLRYALGIVLSGILIWLERRTRNKECKLRLKDVLLYLLIALFAYFTVLVYLILALVIPLFCWLVFRKIKPWLRAAIALVLTGTAAVTANHICTLRSAPYTVSTLADISNAIKELGIYRGGDICIKYLLE